MNRARFFLIVALLVGTSGAWTQGKISGLMYGDYFYNVARDTTFARAPLPNSALTGEKSYQAFQFRRIFYGQGATYGKRPGVSRLLKAVCHRFSPWPVTPVGHDYFGTISTIS